MRKPFVKAGDKVKLKDEAFEVLPQLTRRQMTVAMGVLIVKEVDEPIPVNDVPGGIVYPLDFVEEQPNDFPWIGVDDISVTKTRTPISASSPITV